MFMHGATLVHRVSRDVHARATFEEPALKKRRSIATHVTMVAKPRQQRVHLRR
jgi:ribosomal protein S21